MHEKTGLPILVLGGSKFYFSAHLTSTSILFAHFVFRYFPVHSIHSPVKVFSEGRSIVISITS